MCIGQTMDNGKSYSMEYISRYKDKARLVQALYFAKFISL